MKASANDALPAATTKPAHRVRGLITTSSSVRATKSEEQSPGPEARQLAREESNIGPRGDNPHTDCSDIRFQPVKVPTSDCEW